MSQDNKSRLKQWLESGEARLQPLTLPQRELWEASPVPAGDPANHICAYLYIGGHVTAEGSEAAMQRVVDRQEVFRTSFLPGKEKPMQLIRKTAKTNLALREVPAALGRPELVDELAQETFYRPFDMVGGPLYRGEVLSLSSTEHVLLMSIHHAIADGWSLGVFVQDLFAAYLHNKGLGPPLAAVPMTYSSWGAAERAFWQQPAELEARADFWKNTLKGRTRIWKGDAQPRGPRERWVTHVPAELGRGIRELARRNGATLYSTLLAAFQVTLSKWTGAEDILVGTPVANRGRQGARDFMGYCAGIVPVRGQIDRMRKFSDTLQSVHHAALDAFEHAMPFAELAKALKEPTTEGHNPLFEVRFALQNHPVPDIDVAGFSLRLRMGSTGTYRFDLACEVTEDGDQLEVVWLFRQGLFTLQDIQELHRLYQATLAGVCHSPEVVTSALLTSL